MISDKIIEKEFLMELVYLWVEDYKNIQKQGFNFSPRFRCEYDEDTKELNIVDKDETGEFYPKNFFGDNINVTAIVGENGSGKSKLLKLLIACLNTIVRMLTDTNYLFVIKKDKVLYVISNLSVNTKFKWIQIQWFKADEDVNNKEIKRFLEEIYSSLYDYSLSFNGNNFFDISIQYYPRKNLSIEDIEKIDRRNMIYYLFENNHKDTFGNYFEPNEILLESSSTINDKDTLKNIVDLKKNLKNITEHFLFVIYLYLINQIRSLSPNEMFLELKEITNFENFSMILFEKITNLNPEGFINYLSMKGSTPIQIINNIKNVFEYSKKIKESQIEFENILNSDMNISPREFIINIENFKNSDFLNIFEKLPCFDINFSSSTGMRYNALSNGEKTALRVRFYIEKIIRNNKTKNFIFLLDEPNNDLHPLWQRELQNYLIKVFENREQNFHFIITSHSPFILSDLPKENVIFLEKGKQVYPFEDGKQTFGANIHTLLSHGFFMKDGLMGEFAKDKIQSIIKYHEDIEKKEIIEADKFEYKTKKQKEFWQIQSIIGDDYLKQVIKNHLIEIEKIVLGNDEAKKEEVKRLKAQIELLEK